MKDGKFQRWAHAPADLIEQADRQLEAAGDTPIRWVVAEEEAATAIQALLENEGFDIQVVHVPPVPGESS